MWLPFTSRRRRASALALTAALSAAVLASSAGADGPLLANGGFEGSGSGSLSGWAAESSTLALTSGLDGSHAALVRAARASTYGMHASPNPLSRSTTAGVTYAASGWVRSDQPGRTVCLRLIGLSSAGATLDDAERCLVATSAWAQLPEVDYTTTAAGGSLRFRVYQPGGRSGDSFAVDDLTLSSASAAAGPKAPTLISATASAASGATLSWTEDDPSVDHFDLYRDGVVVASVAAAQRSFTDSGLASGATYRYWLDAVDAAGGDSGPSNAMAVTTSGTDSAATIVAAGDIGCDPRNPSFNGGNGTAAACQQKWTAQTAQTAAPDAVLPLGDLAYDCSGPAELAGGYAPFWGALDAIAHPAVGNHEYQATSSVDSDCTPDGSAYFDYWGAAAGDASKGYYSWDLGSWHMIALNANCTVVSCSATSPQVTWLKQDLAASTKPCILAYWHQPLFNSKGTGSTSTKPFWNALYAAGADVVLNGHVHVYERFAKMAPSGAADANGIREFIVGTGGSDHGGFGSTFPATDEAHNANTFGVLEMRLSSSGYSWQFLPDGHSGSFTDSGSAGCN